MPTFSKGSLFRRRPCASATASTPSRPCFATSAPGTLSSSPSRSPGPSPAPPQIADFPWGNPADHFQAPELGSISLPRKSALAAKAVPTGARVVVVATPTATTPKVASPVLDNLVALFNKLTEFPPTLLS